MNHPFRHEHVAERHMDAGRNQSKDIFLGHKIAGNNMRFERGSTLQVASASDAKDGEVAGRKRGNHAERERWHRRASQRGVGTLLVGKAEWTSVRGQPVL